MALPRPNRLTLKKDFDRVFRSGTVVRSRFFVARKIANTLGILRIGAVVSAKVAHTAVRRNMIRRLIAASAIRNRQPDLGWDVVITARPPKATGRDDLQNDLVHLWQKI